MLKQLFKNKTKAQSTVEYIVLVAAVITVVILFSTHKDSGLQGKLNQTLCETGEDMTQKGEKLFDSHGSDPGGGGTPTAELAVNIQREGL